VAAPVVVNACAIVDAVATPLVVCAVPEPAEIPFVSAAPVAAAL